VHSTSAAIAMGRKWPYPATCFMARDSLTSVRNATP
jgi:hypothetical protein